MDETLDEAAGPAAVTDEDTAAILLMLVEESEAAALLERLGPQQVRQLGHAIYRLTDANETHVHAAIDLFVGRAQEKSTLAHGAPQRLAGAMTRALGPAKAQAILGDVAPATETDHLAELKWMKPAEIVALVEGEHPQLIAVICAHLTPETAAAVVQALPEEDQDDVVYRIATLGPVTAEAIAAVEDLLARAAPPMASGPASRRGGTGDAAAILNAIRKTDEKRIMRALTKRDRDVARLVEADMFTFADLGRLDDRNLGTLLRSVDAALLVPALKGADDALRGRFLACMSSRGAQAIEDDMAERGPMPLAEVAEAQRAVVAIARRLGEEGTLQIGGKGEEYV